MPSIGSMAGSGSMAPAAMAPGSSPQPGTGDPTTMPGEPGTGEPSEDPADEPAGPTPGQDFDYTMEDVRLDSTLTIGAGQTVRVGPGTTFTAAMGVQVLVQGTLIVEGTAASRVRFLGAGVPRSWEGVRIASGGRLDAKHFEVGGASYGIFAEPGSDFTIDYAELGTSFKAAIIQSDGSFDHTRFHASGNPIFSPVNEVSVDDVNGTLTILNASPTVSNSIFDGSAALVDMIRVGGASTPVFDHIHVKPAHCAIHVFGASNNSPVIKNSIFEGHAYGFMAYTSKVIVENSVFKGNANDIGFCFGATAENAPTLRNNFYERGAPVFDPSCVQIGTAEPAPATTANASAGPMGL